MPDDATGGPARHPIHAVSRAHVERWAELAPDEATARGVLGHESRVTDHSPAGRAARLALLHETLAELDGLPPADGPDRTAVDFHRERLSAQVALMESGEDVRALRVIGSPVQAVRQTFDLLPRETAADWGVIADRLEAVADGTAGIARLLDHGRATGLMSARRQAEACRDQCRTWAGLDGAPDFFSTMVAPAGDDDALGRRLRDSARAAAAGYAELASYLEQTYLPQAPIADAVGTERYRTMARAQLGADIDPVEVYAWSWDEFGRIEADMAATAERIVPGAALDEVIEHLETDPDHSVDGEDDLRHWLQDLMDATIDALDGVHFDIPARVKQVEAMIAPPGGAAAMYYTPPSEDFSRPGRTWYPTLGRTRFPLWGEVSICYHEGVPGHHLQLGHVMHLGDELTAFQRLTFVPGHGEGWALYAERLMDELGYLDDPAHRLGYLRAQVMRALRVIVDIGMHLELAIPDHSDFAPGRTWSPELGQQFVTARARFPADFMASEITRYLGWAGQAIAYKVGERAWLDGRAEVSARMGRDFDLTSFHRRALDLGHLGLDQLRVELERFAPS